MAFMVKDGFRLYYEDTGGNAPTLLFLHGAGGNHLSWWQQEQQRGCVAAGVLVVEAKAVLHHERHRATSLVADETRERAGDVDPEPEGHRGVSLAPNRILRNERPRVADLRPAYWRLRPWAKFRARMRQMPCGLARFSTSARRSFRNCSRR